MCIQKNQTKVNISSHVYLCGTKKRKLKQLKARISSFISQGVDTRIRCLFTLSDVELLLIGRLGNIDRAGVLPQRDIFLDFRSTYAQGYEFGIISTGSSLQKNVL